MTERQAFDEDEELRAVLRAGDPSASLAPADARALVLLLDGVSRSDTGAAADSPRRGPVAWLVAAAAAAVVVTAGAGAVHRLTTDDSDATAGRPAASSSPSHSTTSTPPDSSGPASTSPALATLSVVPGSLDARCAPPSSALLAGIDTAFSGTVTRIEGNQVTVRPAMTFHGAVADTVTITAPSEEFGQLVQAVRFEVGHTYLLSSYHGQLAVCGLSGPAKPALQQIYAEAFPR